MERGCSDGSFALRMALQKRREHGLGTYVLFVDLVKAFDSVDRDGMVEVLRKFGVPDQGPPMRPHHPHSHGLHGQGQ